MTSLLRPHLTDFPMRPSDKDLSVFDLDDLFEQYVETDLLQLSDTTAEPSGSDDLAHFFESSNEGDPMETSPMLNWDTSSNDAWHKALHSFDQNLALSPAFSNYIPIYSETRGTASLSDPEFVALEDFCDLDLGEPRRTFSNLPTPKRQVARPKSRNHTTPERVHKHRVQKSLVKANTYTKMMRPATYRAGIPELWTRQTETPMAALNLQLPPSSFNAPSPPTAKVTQVDDTTDFFSTVQPYTVAMSSSMDNTTETHCSNYQLTPMSSPPLDMNARSSNSGTSYSFNNGNMGSHCIPTHIANAALSAMQTPPSSARLSMSAWGTPDAPASLDFSYSTSTSPDFAAFNTQGWWSNNAPTTSTTNVHANGNVNANGQRPPFQRSQSEQISFSSASLHGLGISCDAAPFGTSFGAELSASPSMANQFAASTLSFDSSFPMFASASVDGNVVHIGHPLAHTSPSRSPSHSPLPVAPQPRFHRRRHSSHQMQHHGSSRSHRGSHSHSRKSSHGSNTSHGRHQKSARVGFVNFTPHDSKKILTGVAPSGSSKTKARREKEAAERRRKLSQAVVKAVMEAGGDVKRLEEGGLLTLEVE